MGKSRFLLLLVVVLSLAVSCDLQAMPKTETSLIVASWNVQNLFDAKLDGNEYDEYKPSSGWSDKDYKMRLSNTAKVLSYLPSAGSYIVVLNEIENPNVIDDLIKESYIADLGLHFYACAGLEGAAIQTAVISSLPITGAYVHAVSRSLRPVLEVEVDTPSGKVFVLAVHFKSNVGGNSETSGLRQESADVVHQVASQIQMENPGCLVVICGDMNEECWDENAMTRTGREGPPLKVGTTFGRNLWYCFWLDESLKIWPKGSYMYDGLWKCFDNILVSQAGRDSSGWEVLSCGVVFEGIMKTADQRPNAWDRSLLRGVSDHIPIWALFDDSI